MKSMNAVNIRLADTDADIDRCFPVMSQLRPHLAAADFVETVRRQQGQGFLLAMLEDAGVVRAVAGFRVFDNLVGGRILYVDALVTDSTVRSKGHGKALLDWLTARARTAPSRF